MFHDNIHNNSKVTTDNICIFVMNGNVPPEKKKKKKTFSRE